jgi:adenylosuccinate synthase
MNSAVIVGLQWGDEGKGKIVDLLTERADVVVRCQGGANAGHTVEIGDARYVLHLVPTGILRPDAVNLIGGGVVLDLTALFRELTELFKKGVRWEGRLFVANSAHLVLPYHRLVEQAEERERGDHKIGTTLRGIGPAYADKMARRGVRVGDLFHRDQLVSKLRLALEAHRAKIMTLPDVSLPEPEALADELQEYGHQIRGLLVNASDFLHEQMRANKRILYEGAQGSLLDIDFGTYPYVTSSTTTVGGVLTGLGVNTRAVGDVYGVTKAYCTRVGNGPFPTELANSQGDALREAGREYGATTGRPRRCGWVDGVLLRHTSRLNGTTHLAVTKLDVLDTADPIRVSTGYRNHAGPLDLAYLEGLEPVYEDHPGWKTSTLGITSYAKLPAACRKYLERLSELAEAKLAIVSTGPRRDQTIWM